MPLTTKQKGVRQYMVLGLASSIIILCYAAFFLPTSINTLNPLDRLIVAIKSLLLPLFFLIVSIARLAKHRFFTPEDIDGGALSNSTEQAKILQSLLQNTLEQLTLAVIIYLSWAVVMPAHYLAVVPCAAFTFALGRILFFRGYHNGAPSRALGFTLTFYPTVLMFLCLVGRLFWGFV